MNGRESDIYVSVLATFQKCTQIPRFSGNGAHVQAVDTRLPSLSPPTWPGNEARVLQARVHYDFVWHNAVSFYCFLCGGFQCSCGLLLHTVWVERCRGSLQGTIAALGTFLLVCWAFTVLKTLVSTAFRLTSCKWNERWNLFSMFQHTTLILECLKPSLAVIPVIFDPIQEIMGSVCSFSVVELVDGLQISSVSSAQSDSLTRTSLTHSNLKMITDCMASVPGSLFHKIGRRKPGV